MKNRSVLAPVVLVVLAFSPRVLADCQTDGDCKGERVCRNSECVHVAACHTDKDCPGDQVCTKGACRSEAASQQPAAPNNPTASSKITFVSDQDGAPVRRWYDQIGDYKEECRTPCSLDLPDGAYSFELGGKAANILVKGSPQTWRLGGASPTLRTLSIVGLILGPAMIGGGIALGLQGMNSSHCNGDCSPEAVAETNRADTMMYGGISMSVVGVVLTALSIAGVAVSGNRVSDVTGSSADGRNVSRARVTPNLGLVTTIGSQKPAVGLGLSVAF